MIELIYGSKGTGKTKRIIDMARQSLEKSDGFVVFLADTNRYVREIKYAIRFLNTKEIFIKGEENLVGFIKGLINSNYDKNFLSTAWQNAGVDIQDGLFYESAWTKSAKNMIYILFDISCDKENHSNSFQVD